jgi:beta-galactosidase
MRLVIRVGESVWSTWEPAEGVFDLDWLRPAGDEPEPAGFPVLR